MKPKSRIKLNGQNMISVSQPFLGATKHFYNWLCPLVGWSVGWFRNRSTTHTSHLIGLLGRWEAAYLPLSFKDDSQIRTKIIEVTEGCNWALRLISELHKTKKILLKS